MNPSRQPLTRFSRWLMAGLGLCLALSGPGCAGGRSSRTGGNTMLSGLRPPALIGSQVRSQDGTSLVGRLRRRALPSRQPANPANSSPNIQWSEPGAPATRPNVKPVRPVHITLPSAPTLPGEPPKVAQVSEAQPAAASAQPASPKDDTSEFAQIRALIETGQKQLASIRDYQVTMSRQERVGSTLQPAEEVILSLRHAPRAVRLEWPSGPSQGREVIYSEQETGGQLQIYAPGTLVPRLSLSPDSPLVLSKSRHPITEAGLEDVLQKLDRSLAPHEQGRGAGVSMTYDGLVSRPEAAEPCHQITEVRANGEVWVVALDGQRCLPVLVDGRTASGELLEHYVFRDLHTNLPELAQADAFDPNSRWRSGGGGLLSRLAGTPPAANSGGR